MDILMSTINIVCMLLVQRTKLEIIINGSTCFFFLHLDRCIIKSDIVLVFYMES